MVRCRRVTGKSWPLYVLDLENDRNDNAMQAADGKHQTESPQDSSTVITVQWAYLVQRV